MVASSRTTAMTMTMTMKNQPFSTLLVVVRERQNSIVEPCAGERCGFSLRG